MLYLHININLSLVSMTDTGLISDAKNTDVLTRVVIHLYPKIVRLYVLYIFKSKWIR